MAKSRRGHVAVGAMIIAIPGSAVALTATRAFAQTSAPQPGSATPRAGSIVQLSVRLKARELAYGHDVSVTGTVPSSDAGQVLALEFAPAGSKTWHELESTTVRRDGRFRLVGSLERSGLLKVLGGPSASSTRATVTGDPLAQTGGAFASASEKVTVAAKLSVPDGAVAVLSGESIDLRGKLLPAVAGRRVRLQARGAGGWRTLAAARTGPRGGFDLHYLPGSTGQQRLRVQFAGDRQNGRVLVPAGELTTYTTSVASWYNDGGSTACGFHAHFGVANRDLPCGTQVAFHYGGHTVTAVVDDRGPYVGGRDWDLNQNTAAALGFGGVDTVWSSI